jgi:hypothetical protein
LVAAFGEEMTNTERLGKAAWINYLIAATPIALFYAWMMFVLVRFFFIQVIGPLEELPSSVLQQGFFWCSLISLPGTWFFGFAVAHRFDGERLRAIPFIANMLPVSGLLWFASVLRREEGVEFIWMIFYIGFLLVLLVFGLTSVLVVRKPKPSNKASVIT